MSEQKGNHRVEDKVARLRTMAIKGAASLGGRRDRPEELEQLYLE
jgi:hypothetical protein